MSTLSQFQTIGMFFCLLTSTMLLIMEASIFCVIAPRNALTITSIKTPYLLSIVRSKSVSLFHRQDVRCGPFIPIINFPQSYIAA